MGDRIREAATLVRPDPRVEQGEKAGGSPPRGPGVTAWYVIAANANPHDVRVSDTATRFAHRIDVRDAPALAFPELMDPVDPMFQNHSVDDVELVFTPLAIFGTGILVPAGTWWTRRASGPLLASPAATTHVITDAGSVSDITDRVARLLGHTLDDGEGKPWAQFGTSNGDFLSLGQYEPNPNAQLKVGNSGPFQWLRFELWTAGIVTIDWGTPSAGTFTFHKSQIWLDHPLELSAKKLGRTIANFFAYPANSLASFAVVVWSGSF